MSIQNGWHDRTLAPGGEFVLDKATTPEVASDREASEMAGIGQPNQCQTLPIVTKIQIHHSRDITVRGRPMHHAASGREQQRDSRIVQASNMLESATMFQPMN